MPPAVQDKILDICGRHLARTASAYVSYNTYPGWHLRGMIRDMMPYHVSRFPDRSPARQVGRARALLDFLARSAPRQDGPYGLFLREQLDHLRELPDAYLFHEHLEECNTPLYFLGVL